MCIYSSSTHVRTLISSVSTCPSSVGESRIVSATAYCAGSSHVGYPSRSGASVGNESESGDVYVEGTYRGVEVVHEISKARRSENIDYHNLAIQIRKGGIGLVSGGHCF